MSRFDQSFIEQVFRIYAPEDSPMFEELRDTMAYQMGLRDGLSIKGEKHQRGKTYDSQ